MRARFSLASHLIPYSEGTNIVVATLLIAFKRRCQPSFRRIQQHVLRWMRLKSRSFLSGTLTDLARTKSELVAENALLRQQLMILRRQVKRPPCTMSDRLLLVVLARPARNWKQALYIVQPTTLLGWHRQAFRWFWRQRSEAADGPVLDVPILGGLHHEYQRVAWRPASHLLFLGFDDEESKMSAEEGIRDRQEVARPDLMGMVVQEGAPSL
jgi:hypothetical protein